MCTIVLSAVLFFPIASLGLIYVEQECKSAFRQKKQFKRQIDEMEVIMEQLRRIYDA
jgi:hypothetical protein